MTRAERPAPGTGFGFVGRQRELARLVEALRLPPAVVLVEGEAGIGKSRLVAEAAAASGLPADRLLTGYCHPLREPLPFGPVVDALRRIAPLLPRVELVPPSAGLLAGLLPDLADRLPPASGGGSPGGGSSTTTSDERAPVVPSFPAAGSAGAGSGHELPTDRHRLVRAVRALLGVLGEVVLVVEDVHWVDDATRELLLLLARDPLPGVSLVLTYRAEDLPPDTPVLGAAYRRPPGVGGALLRLGPLAEQEVHQLARAALGRRATPALARVLFDRSEGLPLVAEEDLITLCEQGAGGLADPADLAADLEHSEVPRGLRDAVTERLAGLGPAASAVVEAVAVLAVPAEEELIGAVAGLDAEAVADGLTEALGAAALQEAAPARYAFRHALAQQVAYRRIPGPRRTALHRRAVAALDHRDPPPLVRIAHHTLALGDRPAWQRAAEAAVDQAVALGDTGSAGPLLRRLLAEDGLAPERRGRAARTLGWIAANAVDASASAGVLTGIIADPRLPEADRGEVRLTLGMLMATHGGDRAGFAQIEQAVDELSDRPQRAARALVALAMDEREGAGARCWTLLDRAAEALSAAPDEEVAAAARATRLTFLARESDPALWPELERLPTGSPSAEIVRQTTRALYNVGDIALTLGHDRRAGRLLARSRVLARQAAIPYLECYSRIALLRLDGLAGRWQGLEERFAALGAEFPDLAMAGAERALLLGRLEAARGQLAAAREQFEAASRYGERESQVTGAIRAAAGLAALDLAEGEAARAAKALAPALAILREARAWARGAELLPVAVEAALASGDPAAARDLVAEAERGLAGTDAPAARAALALAEGLLREPSAPAAATTAFTHARDTWHAIGRPYEAAQAEERLARTLARATSAGLAVASAASPGRAVASPGRSTPSPADSDLMPEASSLPASAESSRRAAAEALASAERVYGELGAASDLARCQYLRRDLGLGRPASPGRRGYGGGLSPRERQVAELVARGAGNQDVAQALFLSPRTVEHHVSNVLRKLGVARRDLGRALAAERES